MLYNFNKLNWLKKMSCSCEIIPLIPAVLSVADPSYSCRIIGCGSFLFLPYYQLRILLIPAVLSDAKLYFYLCQTVSAKLFNIRSFTFVHSSEMDAYSARP